MIQQMRPTQRAPDLGYAARFLSFFVALSFFRFDSESTLPPQAGNASRWALCLKYKILEKYWGDGSIQPD